MSRQANSPATVGLLLLQDLSLILNFFFRFFFMAPRPTATAVSSSYLSRTCLTGRDTSKNDNSHPHHQNQDPYIELWDGESLEDATLQSDDAVSDVEEEPAVVSNSDVSTSDFVTPAESPAHFSSESSSEEAQGEARSTYSARRAQRLRRGRNFLTYDRLGEPKISRYTMMATEHRP